MLIDQCLFFYARNMVLLISTLRNVAVLGNDIFSVFRSFVLKFSQVFRLSNIIYIYLNLVLAPAISKELYVVTKCDNLACLSSKKAVAYHIKPFFITYTIPHYVFVTFDPGHGPYRMHLQGGKIRNNLKNQLHIELNYQKWKEQCERGLL